MKIGLTLPNRGVLFGVTTPEEMMRMSEVADQSGKFASVWVGDSLLGNSDRRCRCLGRGFPHLVLIVGVDRAICCSNSASSSAERSRAADFITFSRLRISFARSSRSDFVIGLAVTISRCRRCRSAGVIAFSPIGGRGMALPRFRDVP